ncbi:aminodeoxychorismate/anthranilate synthase component II [Listeria sp. PSOL-1]|uniref:anthranilate synthase component II n=1 Tax=Listeria sp. PSOL-1 TaxID=1844999 RepID=UPI0013D0308A|nr:aminodeoxychorismate/anthranilate synthase component II [Listeria sp. PSOL-1]
MILLIDHHDSFTYNLYQYFLELGTNVDVVYPEKLAHITNFSYYKGIVLSPGPGSPETKKETLAFLAKIPTDMPILGICLGHQIIAYHFGGKIIKAPAPFHGKTSEVMTYPSKLFQDIPKKITVTRYHSLIVPRETLPNNLLITAETDNQLIMALEHRFLPIMSVQFHPEAILSTYGHQILANFLQFAEGRNR